MITDLTNEQKERMCKIREEALSIGYSTAPIDMREIEQSVEYFYKRINKKMPTIFICWSPLGNIIFPNQGNFNGTALHTDTSGAGAGRFSKAPALWANLRVNLETNLWANLRVNLETNLWNNLRVNLGDNLWANLRDNLWANLETNLRDNLRVNLETNLWANLGDNLWANLRDNLWANLETNLRDNLRVNLRDNLWANLRVNLETNLWANLRVNLETNLWNNLRVNLGDNLWANLRGYWNWGAWELGWITYYLFANEIGISYNENDLELLKNHNQYARSALWMNAYENIVFVSQRPTEIHLKALNPTTNVLHSDGGMAIKFQDGYGLWALNGVEVSKEIAEIPAEKLNPELIITEQNAEVRREIVRKIGVERVIQKLGAKTLDKWYDYELLEITKPIKARYLKMRNPSIGVWHVEGVPVEIKTCLEALHFRKPKALQELPIDEQGEDWYQQGDVCIWSADAKTVKPLPSILT